MLRTPSNLEILLHVYVNPDPHPRRTAPAVRQGYEYLLLNGLINQRSANDYKISEKGEFYLLHLLNIPFPVSTHSFAIPGAL